MRYTIVLALLCPLLSCSQPRKVLQTTPPSSVINHPPSLSIGDQLPAIQLNNLANHSASRVSLTSFTGKPLLISFFATWCGTCLREVPKLAAAQKLYGDSLQVLLVTYESTEEFAAAQKRNAFWASLQLPLVLYDTLLRQLFPYRMVPHNVWVNRGGSIRAITGAEELTHANISAFVSGRALALPLKKDVLDFNPDKPLLQEGNGGSPEALLSRSSFTSYLPGMPTSSGYRKEGATLRSWHINQPILSLYTALLNLQPNRILLEVKDTARYYIPATLTAAWKKANLYTYELATPATLPKQKRQQWALEDLNRYLGLHGHFKRRSTACWVLVHTGNAEQQSPAEAPTATRKFTLAQLLAALNRSQPAKRPGPIVLDETGITNPLYLELSADLSNRPALRKDLARYGLDLIPTERDLDVFVLSEEP